MHYHGLGLPAKYTEGRAPSEKDLLINKLHPSKVPSKVTGFSPQMYLIVSSILGQSWSVGLSNQDSLRPGRGFSITSDGFVTSGRLFLGSVAQFVVDIRLYLDAAKLSQADRIAFWALYDDIVSDWRPGGNAWSGGHNED